MRRTRGRRLVSAAVAVAFLGAAACGDDGEEPNESSPETTAAADVDAPTGTPIKIVSIAPEGTELTNHPEVPAALEAAAMAINADGGIGGQPVEIISCNDEGNAQGAAECAQQAVDVDATAVVGSPSPNGDAMNPILEAAGIPNIGNTASQASDMSSPISFPVNTGGINAYQGAVFAMAEMGLTKLGVVSLDIPTAATILGALQPAFDAARTPDGEPVEMVGSVKIPLTASDFAPYAAALRDMGAEGVVALTSAQHMIALMNADAAIGNDVVLGAHATNFSAEDTIAIGGIDGTLIATHPLLPPTSDADGPTRFRAEMQAADDAGVDAADDLSYTAFYAWTGMQAMRVIAETIDGEVNAASLLEALESAQDVDVDGLLPEPWTPVDPSRSEAVAKIALTTVNVVKIEPDGTWSLLFDEPIDVAEARGT